MATGSLRFDDVHINELLSTVGVGTWDWDLTTGRVVYSAAWGHILGYSLAELPQTVKTWESRVLPIDLPSANAQIESHLSGEKPIYEAEFRMICKNGNVIWAQDKGQVIEYNEAGEPVRFMGVLQNVSRLKEVELRLLENQESLDLAVSVAELGTWDWDIPGDFIRYNDEYLTMLGRSQENMTGSMEEWEAMNHPEDLVFSSRLLTDYLEGRADSYTCEIRMKHREGHYIWTRDVGRIVTRDATGAPIRLIGGHLNINGLKISEAKLTEALEALAYNNSNLESEVENRTKELMEQERLLWTVNQISRKLLTFGVNERFEDLVRDCLRLLGESINQSRVYIWKDRRGDDGRVYCTQIYEWVRGVIAIQGNAEFEEIPYADLPFFERAIDADICLNSLVRALSIREQEILGSQGIKTILIAPVTINGVRWGFIGVDNCENEVLFTSTEESLLHTSGSLLGSTIEKMETAAKLHEMEERTQIMLDATPLCCNLWTDDFQNMSCNQEAVRLFGLSSQKEYLERFHELSPTHQPSGRLSSELSLECITRAFSEGYVRFNWLHQRLDGTPIPAEITLVRIKYKDHFIVTGYTRDLREFNAMLAALQSKEYDLRTARDEALLSSKAKTNFLANMSHEIRTPMNAIAGLAEIILRESRDDKTAEQAKGIKSACSNLLSIINDILDISKIESGKLEIYKSQYELASLLNDVIAICRMRLGRKQLRFITYIDSHIPAQLVGDEIRIKQILINFISNAIKFTEEGSIVLRVSATVEGEQAMLRFSVKDSGVGIKQEDLHRLFAEFERVNTTKNRNIEGTGLGLAISKQLCEMMGGQIVVESVYGKWSEFIAYIPQECLAYEPISQIEKPKNVLLYEPRDLCRHSVEESLASLGCTCVSCANQSELYDNISAMSYDYLLAPALHLSKVQALVRKKELTVSVAVFVDRDETVSDNTVLTISLPVSCLQLANLLNGHFEERHLRHHADLIHFTAPMARVLVVDDNMVNLHVAEGLMAPYHFAIDTANNGLEAVAMVQQSQYDLVFMDHMMPEMDGIDATVAIRQLSGEYFKNLPIVALTANALVGTREMFIGEGMNDFLAKPIEIKKLVQVLLKWLPQSKIVRGSPTGTKPHENHKASFKIEGINTTQGVLSVGGNEENYLHILASFYADGNQKCVSLLRHVNEKNIAAFRTEVHAVKSTSAVIGALKLSDMAAKLELAALQKNNDYIDENLDGFLSELKESLENIRPVLATELVPHHNHTSEEAQGDMAVLKCVLPVLYDAIEFANISQIEKSMDQLEENAWPERITRELFNIRDYLAVFDYDGALGCVARLKECI